MTRVFPRTIDKMDDDTQVRLTKADAILLIKSIEHPKSINLKLKVASERYKTKSQS